MTRFLGVLAALLLVLGLAAPTVAAADPALAHTGRVLVSTDGSIDVPADEHVDLLVVVNGTATVAGEVNSIVAVDSTVSIDGATVEGIVAVGSPLTLGPGTRILGDVSRFDSQVHLVGDAQVGGQVRDLAADLAGLGFVLGPLALLLYLGFALAAIAGGLLLAALAARQVRAAEAIISREPAQALLAAIVGVVVTILVIVGLFVTIVGVPLAIAILMGVWPAVAIVGYLVAGIWLGDWILRRTSPGDERERPYLAAVVGILVLEVLGIWPFVAMIASLFGYGAVLLLAWRTFRAGGQPRPVVTAPAASPA